MKKAALILLSFASLAASAQKIKIKKDKISIDQTEVAIIDKEKLVYKIISLDNRPIFSIERKMSPLLDGSVVYWSILTDLTTNKTNEVIDYGKDQGLSFQNAIVASVCNDKYKFISVAGIDEKGVADFINGTPTDIEKVFADANIKTKNQINTENEAMVKAKISVQNGEILQIQEVNGKETKIIIGSIRKKSKEYMTGFPPVIFYEVVDQNSRKKMASWYAETREYTDPSTDKYVKNQIVTEDNKFFRLKGGGSGMEKMSSQGLDKKEMFFYANESLLPSRIVAKLLYNGYTFDAMNLK